jgi:hypothetical protein
MGEMTTAVHSTLQGTNGLEGGAGPDDSLGSSNQQASHLFVRISTKGDLPTLFHGNGSKHRSTSFVGMLRMSPGYTVANWKLQWGPWFIQGI